MVKKSTKTGMKGSEGGKKDKFLWLTDIHLDHIRDLPLGSLFSAKNLIKSWLKKIDKKKYKFIVITGDIATSVGLSVYLKGLSDSLTKTRYFFVLGNHDFYHSSVAKVRASLESTDGYFGTQSVLYKDTVVIGIDGFADGQLGILDGTIMLNDQYLIDDYYNLWKGNYSTYQYLAKIKDKMKKLAVHDASTYANKLQDALLNPDITTVYIATHVPPFKEASFYKIGQPTDDQYLPFFCNSTLGNEIIKQADLRPNITFKVLCGHTHCEADVDGLGKHKNVSCQVQGAEYGQLSDGIEIEL